MKPAAGVAPPSPLTGELKLLATEETRTLSQQLYDLIIRQPFFKGLSVAHLQLLADSALEMRFETGQLIFTEGSPANRFYLMLEGKVTLESEAKEHGTIMIQTLGPGDDLGWSWLFPPYSFHFTAHAVEPTRTIFFYGTRLREQCDQEHELGYQLMMRIAEVGVQRLRAVQQRLMECTNPDQLQQ